MKKLLSLLLAAVMVLSLCVGCGSSTSNSGSSETTAETAAAGGDTYKIAVSNAYMGNDWRQVMIKCLQVAATKDAWKDKVTLDIVNSENSAEAQASAIDAMVEQGYDAILVDASSSSALIPAIQRAQAAGITVVSFDSTVEGTYTVSTDFVTMVQCWATYLCEKCGKGAKIAVDTGMPGSTNGNTIYEAAIAIFDEYEMDVVAEFASEYADGVCQEQLASVLAAHPDLDGIFCQAYVESCYAALTAAGMDMIPVSAFDTNLGMKTALENDLDAIIGNNCPGLGVIALDVAIRVLDGEEVEQDTLVTPGIFVNAKDTGIELPLESVAIEKDVNVWDDVADGMDWPALPADFTTVELTIEDISDFAQN